MCGWARVSPIFVFFLCSRQQTLVLSLFVNIGHSERNFVLWSQLSTRWAKYSERPPKRLYTTVCLFQLQQVILTHYCYTGIHYQLLLWACCKVVQTMQFYSKVSYYTTDFGFASALIMAGTLWPMPVGKMIASTETSATNAGNTRINHRLVGRRWSAPQTTLHCGSSGSSVWLFMVEHHRFSI